MKEGTVDGRGRRRYRMGARAEAAAETGRKIVGATIGLYTERYFDQVSLEDIAGRAGVTVQTVLRRFGSKDQLIDAASEEVRGRVSEQRDEAPVGDVAGAVENLVDHYEEQGEGVLRLLAQEDRVPAFRRATDTGRSMHRDWVWRTFEPFLSSREGEDRERLLAQLVAVCDVYVWKVLRKDMGLGRRQTELALVEMVEALKGEE